MSAPPSSRAITTSTSPESHANMRGVQFPNCKEMIVKYETKMGAIRSLDTNSFGKLINDHEGESREKKENEEIDLTAACCSLISCPCCIRINASALFFSLIARHSAGSDIFCLRRNKSLCSEANRSDLELFAAVCVKCQQQSRAKAAILEAE